MSKPQSKDVNKKPTARTALPATLRFDPLSYRIDDAAAVIGVSKAKMQTLVNEGRVPTRKLDGCTVILRDDLYTFVTTLPPGSAMKAAQ